jgi:hypothetical protein
MNADQFASIFDAEVREPLAKAGFRSSNKSLFFYTETFGCLSLIRLGGRFTRPGQIAHVLCFRHLFLRQLDETVPRGFCSETFAYPYKLRLTDFAAGAEPPRYHPRNLRYDWDRLPFDGVALPRLRKELQQLCTLLLERALPWARSMTPGRAADEMRLHGEDAWIERIWLADYSAHLAKTQA